jgi:hypothetical protein
MESEPPVPGDGAVRVLDIENRHDRFVHLGNVTSVPDRGGVDSLDEFDLQRLQLRFIVDPGGEQIKAVDDWDTSLFTEQ